MYPRVASRLTNIQGVLRPQQTNISIPQQTSPLLSRTYDDTGAIRAVSVSHSSASERQDSHVTQDRQQKVDPYPPNAISPFPWIGEQGDLQKSAPHPRSRKTPLRIVHEVSVGYGWRERGGTYTGGRMIAKICPRKRQIDQSVVTIHESPPVWTQDDHATGDASSP